MIRLSEKLLMLSGILFSFCAWIALACYFLIDEELSEESKYLLDIPKVDINDNSFLFWKGINAPKEQDPVIYGRIIIQKMQQDADKNESIIEKIINPSKNEPNVDELVDLNLLTNDCNMGDPECFSAALKNIDAPCYNCDLAIERLDTFFKKFNENRLFEHSIFVSDTNFIERVNRFKLNVAIKAARNNNCSLTKSMLNESLKNYALMFSATGSVSSDYPLFRSILDTINVYSFIATSYCVNDFHTNKIQVHFSDNLIQFLKIDFATFDAQIREMEQKYSLKNSSLTSYLKARIFLKPNKSRNMLAKYFIIQKNSQNIQIETSTYKNNKRSQVFSFQLNNFFGVRLANVYAYDYSSLKNITTSLNLRIEDLNHLLAENDNESYSNNCQSKDSLKLGACLITAKSLRNINKY